MQVKPTSVCVKDKENKTNEFSNPTVLMGDYGLWLKEEGGEHLTLYTWERVLSIHFDDPDKIKAVWEEAVLSVFEDLLDDFDELDDEEVIEVPATEETPTETKPDEKPPEDSTPKADDPEVNPYE